MEYFDVSNVEKNVVLKVCQLCAVDFTLKHFLTPLIDCMEKKGWEVKSVCSDTGYVKDLQNKGYKIEVIKISRSLNIFNHIKSFISLVKYFKKENFDILHVHTPVASLIGRFAAAYCKIPTIIYTAHGFYFHDEMPNLKRQIYIKLEKIGANFTHLLFTQSKEDANFAKKMKFLSSNRIFFIGNGVDKNKFSETKYPSIDKIRKTMSIPNDSIVIGIIGRLVKEKGYLEFLDAAIKLHEKYKKTFFLIIGERISSDHNQSIKFKLDHSKEKIGKNLLTISQSENIPKLIKSMDIFCLPSHREGMPRSIIEAMMMSKPVVATNIRGSREEVINGKTGLLVPTKNSNELFKALELLIINKKLILKFGIQGKKRALNLYCENKIIERQIYLIEKYILAEKKK